PIQGTFGCVRVSVFIGLVAIPRYFALGDDFLSENDCFVVPPFNGFQQAGQVVVCPCLRKQPPVIINRTVIGEPITVFIDGLVKYIHLFIAHWLLSESWAFHRLLQSCDHVGPYNRPYRLPSSSRREVQPHRSMPRK